MKVITVKIWGKVTITWWQLHHTTTSDTQKSLFLIFPVFQNIKIHLNLAHIIKKMIKEASETNNSESDIEKCSISEQFWLQDCELVVFVKWAQCYAEHCDHWTHLQFCFSRKWLNKTKCCFCCRYFSKICCFFINLSG